jgi:hypothetical protein
MRFFLGSEPIPRIPHHGFRYVGRVVRRQFVSGKTIKGALGACGVHHLDVERHVTWKRQVITSRIQYEPTIQPARSYWKVLAVERRLPHRGGARLAEARGEGPPTGGGVIATWLECERGAASGLLHR